VFGRGRRPNRDYLDRESRRLDRFYSELSSKANVSHDRQPRPETGFIGPFLHAPAVEKGREQRQTLQLPMSLSMDGPLLTAGGCPSG
jgi:hypothetical protein